MRKYLRQVEQRPATLSASDSAMLTSVADLLWAEASGYVPVDDQLTRYISTCSTRYREARVDGIMTVRSIWGYLCVVD